MKTRTPPYRYAIEFVGNKIGQRITNVVWIFFVIDYITLLSGNDIHM